RLSRTTRSILRCAVAEVKAVKTPASIVINESVEIAKIYSTEQDAAFINGVLGAMSRNGGI
ncbi:MAG: N utilization substance protein B, partial [Clostridia bacterium]|nr:N utilization substance protein B [Clostridia bacterium]